MWEPIEGCWIELQRRTADGRASLHDVLRDVVQEAGLNDRQRRRLRTLHRIGVEHRQAVRAALDEATPNGVAKPLADLVRAVAVRVLAGDLGPGDAARRLPWVDWQKVRALPQELGAGLDDDGRIAAQTNLPRPVVQQLRAAYGDETEAIARGLSGPAPLFLRANPIQGATDVLQAELAEEGVETRPVGWSVGALEVIGRPALFRTRAHRRGAFEVQDAASQLVADLVAPPEGGCVLDACAGAGGKTLALLGRWPSIDLLATDIDRERLATLGRRVRRGRHAMPQVLRVAPDAWPSDVVAFARSADRILLDAPCSGMGSLRRHPELRERWTEAGHRKTLGIQRELLVRAVRLLRPGARVIYATCSVLPEENEVQIEHVLRSEVGLTLMHASTVLGAEAAPALTDDGRFVRTWPHRHGADGFFAAVLARPPNGDEDPPRASRSGGDEGRASRPAGGCAAIGPAPPR